MAKIRSDELQRKIHNFLVREPIFKFDSSLESGRPGLSDKIEMKRMSYEINFIIDVFSFFLSPPHNIFV